MALRRRKHPVVFAAVGGFYGPSVPYIAHAILNDGTAIALGPETAGDGNQNFSMNHPDQRFWTQNAVAIRAALAGNTGNIRRIEIDCALLPCTVTGGCHLRVPALIRGLYTGAASATLANVALRIFSHRDENMAKIGDTSDHRYYDSSTNVNTDQIVAYNSHRGWGWVPASTNLQYATDHQAII